MRKVTMGTQILFYPLPAVLIGTVVEGLPDFMVAAWSGVAANDPPAVTVGIRPSRHTHKGILQNMAFSVNIASVDMVAELDYCGITSGSKVNKVDICKFKLFYGKLANAPLIEDCPVNLECRVAHMLDLGSHSLVVGKIEETHITEDCLTEGKPDVDKIRPFIYVTNPARQYRAFGPVIAKAHSIGEKLKGKANIP